MDANKLSVKKDKAIIIPRALYATSKDNFEENILKLETFYSQQEIAYELRKTREQISNEVCVLVTKRYDVEPFFRYSL